MRQSAARVAVVPGGSQRCLWERAPRRSAWTVLYRVIGNRERHDYIALRSSLLKGAFDSSIKALYSLVLGAGGRMLRVLAMSTTACFKGTYLLYGGGQPLKPPAPRCARSRHRIRRTLHSTL